MRNPRAWNPVGNSPHTIFNKKGLVAAEGSAMLIKGERRRRRGVHCNAAMRIDPYLQNTCLLDPVGGSMSFYDTKVKLVKL